MAIHLGDAVIKILGDDAGLEKALGNVKKRLDAFAKAAVVAGTAITGGFIAATLSFSRAGDEIAKMSKRTGLGTTALSELKHAADLSGASLGELELSVRTLQRNLYDAAHGIGEGKVALEDLGLAAEDLVGLSMETQFFKVAMAIADVSDVGTKAGLSMKLFGRSGTALLPMLAEGAEGLAKMRKEAHELGIVFDQKAALQAEQLNDAIGRLKESLQGLGYSIAKQVLPEVLGMLEWAKEMIIRAKDMIPQLKSLVVETLKWGVALLGAGTALLLLPKILAGLAAVLSPGGLIVGGLAAFALWVAKKRWLDPIVDSFRRVGAAMQQEKPLEPAKEQLTALEDQIGKLEKELGFIETRLEGGAPGIPAATYPEEAGLLARAQEIKDQLAILWDAYRKEQERLWAEHMVEVGKIYQGLVAKNREVADQTTYDWKVAFAEWVQMPGSFQRAVVETFGKIINAIASDFKAIYDIVAKFLSDSFRAFWKSIVEGSESAFKQMSVFLETWVLAPLRAFVEWWKRNMTSARFEVPVPRGVGRPGGPVSGGENMRLAPAAAGTTLNFGPGAIQVNMGAMAGGVTGQDVAREVMGAIRRATLLGR